MRWLSASHGHVASACRRRLSSPPPSLPLRSGQRTGGPRTGPPSPLDSLAPFLRRGAMPPAPHACQLNGLAGIRCFVPILRADIIRPNAAPNKHPRVGYAEKGAGRRTAHKQAEATVFASAAVTARSAKGTTPASEPEHPPCSGGKERTSPNQRLPRAEGAVMGAGRSPAHQ